MKFKRTINSINNLSSYKNDDVTVLNVFDLFHDICEDVKSEGGKAVADFPIGDTGALVTRLIWLSRMVLRINRENQENINQLEDKAKRFFDVCKDVEKTSADIEKYEAIIKDSQKKEQELESNLLELKRLQSQNIEIIENCSQLESEIAKYSDIKIEEVKTKYNDLLAQLEAVKAEYNNKLEEFNTLNQQYTQLEAEVGEQEKSNLNAQQQLLATTERLSQLKEQHSGLTAQTDNATQECTAVENELLQLKANLLEYTDTKIPAIQNEAEQIKLDIEAVKNSYQEKELEHSNLKEEYLSLQQQEEAKREEVAKIEIEVVSIRDIVAGLEEKHLSVQNEISQLGGERQKLIDDIRLLEKELEVNDVEALKAILVSKNQELLSCKAECDQINCEISEQQKSFDEMFEDLENKKKIKQDMIWECEKQISDKNAEIATLEQQLDACQTERSAIIQKATQTQEELLQLKAWFESVDAVSYADRIKSCTDGINRMKNAMSMLERETGLANLLNADTRVSLNELKKYFRDNIDDIEQRLKTYQKSYQIVLNNIDNGGCVI